MRKRTKPNPPSERREIVSYAGEQFGEARFRIAHGHWYELVEWLDSNGIDFYDASTIFYQIIRIKREHETFVRVAWDGRMTAI